MKRFIPFFLLISLFSANSWAMTHLDNVKTGDVIAVQLHQLKPTQASVGFDQIFYKLGRYQADKEKLFDEICEANGQQAVKQFDRHSSPAIADSFDCTAAIGTDKSAMKTVVISPDNQLYLTDGHHTFNGFWHMSDGGNNYTVHVRVAQDYRQLSMAKFWQKMVADNNLWLFDEQFKPIEREALPTSLGLEHFHNNVYRSLAYFTREIAWDKPVPAINFVEFYWGKAIQSKIDLSRYDLNSKDGYKQAVKDVADTILAINVTDVGGSGKTAKQMGQYGGFDKKEFKKLFSKNKKIDYLMRYKKQSSANGLDFDKTASNSHLMQLKDELTLSSATDLMSLPAINAAGTVNAIIEIPAGTLAKWELDKAQPQQIAWEIKNDKPRVVEYLGYPGNYGMIPGTALPKALGGDGDPLDVIVLGQSVPRGQVLPIRLIAVLKLLDDGEQDDKLIAVMTDNTPFADIESLAQLQAEFPGITDIIELWFTHYKGSNGGMEAQGLADKKAAMAVLEQAINAYQAL